MKVPRYIGIIWHVGTGTVQYYRGHHDAELKNAVVLSGPMSTA